MISSLFFSLIAFKSRNSARTVIVAKVADDQEGWMEDVGGVKYTFLVHKDLLEYEHETEKHHEKTKKYCEEFGKQSRSLRPQIRRFRISRMNYPQSGAH
ncbi:hypothetical protein ACOSP7_028186 [Xanthoceras sorbifolium]